MKRALSLNARRSVKDIAHAMNAALDKTGKGIDPFVSSAARRVLARTEWQPGRRRPAPPIKKRVMANTYTAITKRVGNWWIGWIEEVPGVNCQERTRKELLKSLKISLREILALNREEAIHAAASDYSEEPVRV